jgi:hypothetical protein
MDQSIRLMSDQERELHIKDCGELMQAAMARYEASNNLHAKLIGKTNHARSQ